MHLELPTKRYYSIGEIAKAFDVNASLIRFWDKEFEALKPKKNAKGNRKFTPEDIKNLKFIYHLVKERGFTLEGAKTHLKEEKQKWKDLDDTLEKGIEADTLLPKQEREMEDKLVAMQGSVDTLSRRIESNARQEYTN